MGIIGGMQSGREATNLAQHISTSLEKKLKEGETQEDREDSTRQKKKQIALLYQIGEYISNKTDRTFLKAQLLAAIS